jgi:hypothetical protein
MRPSPTDVIVNRRIVVAVYVGPCQQSSLGVPNKVEAMHEFGICADRCCQFVYLLVDAREKAICLGANLHVEDVDTRKVLLDPILRM